MSRKRRRHIARSRKAQNGSRTAHLDQGSSQDAGQLIAAAVQAHRAGEFDTAETIYRRLLERDPDHPDALHLLGLVAQQRGNGQEAAALIGRAIDNRPDFVEAHNNLGNLLQDEGRLSEAAASFSRALALKPDYVLALFNLGNVMRALGDNEAAIARYRHAVEIKPSYAQAHNNLGSVLKQQGRLKEAEASYRHVLALQPNDANAHHNLGAMLHDQGDLDAAAVCYRRALELQPARAGTLHNLGNLRRDQGELGDAATAYQQALEAGPAAPAPYSNLGAVRYAQGRLDEAIAFYRQALQLAPDYAPALNNLSRALIEQGAVDAAGDCCRQVLTQDPQNAVARNALGDVLKAQGRFADASREYEQALTIDPDYVMPYANLAAINKIGAADPLVGVLQKLLQRSALPVLDRAQAHFALGKCCDDIGAFDNAFEHYRQANGIQRTLRSFDGDALVRATERTLATFTREFFRSRDAFGNETPRPIFIVGMPRSGTTLVEQILAAHGEVLGAGELPYVSQLAARISAQNGDGVPYPEGAARIDAEGARSLAQGYVEHLTALAGDVARVTDKAINNFHYLGLIALLFPRARIIHCQRDPLDVCLSCYFQNFSTQPFSHDLEDIGLYYRQYERLMDHWRAVLPTPMLELRYEDLIGDSEAVSRRMVAFCDLILGRCLPGFSQQ